MMNLSVRILDFRIHMWKTLRALLFTSLAHQVVLREWNEVQSSTCLRNLALLYAECGKASHSCLSRLSHSLLRCLYPYLLVGMRIPLFLSLHRGDSIRQCRLRFHWLGSVGWYHFCAKTWLSCWCSLAFSVEFEAWVVFHRFARWCWQCTNTCLSSWLASVLSWWNL